MLDSLNRYGTVLEVEPPKARLRIERPEVPGVLAAILDKYAVVDIAVEDPPLEDVIADVFSQVDEISSDDAPAHST